MAIVRRYGYVTVQEELAPGSHWEGLLGLGRVILIPLLPVALSIMKASYFWVLIIQFGLPTIVALGLEVFSGCS